MEVPHGKKMRYRRTADNRWKDTGTTQPPAEIWWNRDGWIVLKVPGYGDYAGGGETVYLPSAFIFGRLIDAGLDEMTVEVMGEFAATDRGRRSEWAPQGTIQAD
jgi:hypothetical protein